ncbi:hypothetical protein [Pelagibacterium montanilacus]|uniref:hypothetical protein n=1 Tax=Pelagibacterium montanilacus TaxID=2185280 RepID=UPI000F8D215C|nr:hypothetical protein [Pelagibacterium montanilacus]
MTGRHLPHPLALSLALALGLVSGTQAQTGGVGGQPRLDRNSAPPAACVVRVVVPMDRSDRAMTSSATVQLQLRARGALQGTQLGNPRVSDTGLTMVFTFDRPSAGCDQPIGVRALVTCSTRAGSGGVGASFTSTYDFPSRTGFARLTEVAVPASC